MQKLISVGFAMWLVGLGALLLHCASPSTTTVSVTPGSAKERSAYDVWHEGFGLRTHLDGWTVYQTASEAPQEIAIALATKAGPDDPPLFVATRDGMVATVAVLAGIPSTPEEFLHLLKGAMAGQADIQNAQEIRDTGDVLYRGRVNVGIASIPLYGLIRAQHGQIVHIVLNGEASSLDLEPLLSVAAQIELRSGSQWSRPWQDLQSPIADDPLPGFLALHESMPAPIDVFVPADCRAGESPLMWRTDTGKGQIFLFGSLHIGHKSFYPFSEAVEAAFAGASRVVVEIDIARSEENAEAVLAEFANQPTISEVLSPEEYARVAEFSIRHGYPPAAMDTMSAGVAAVTLSLLPFMAHGFDPNAGVDQYFLDHAEDRQVIELESSESQLELISDVTETLLDLLLDSLDSADDDVKALHQAWRCGDEAGLVEMTLTLPHGRSDGSAESRAEIEAFQAAFIDDRNASMAESIATLADLDGDTFVVVGAAHLVGERGIPALLRAAGHQVDLVAR